MPSADVWCPTTPGRGGLRAPLGSAIGLTARGGAYLGQRDPTTGPEVGTHPGHRHPRLGPRGPPTSGCAVLRARGGGHFWRRNRENRAKFPKCN